VSAPQPRRRRRALLTLGAAILVGLVVTGVLVVTAGAGTTSGAVSAPEPERAPTTGPAPGSALEAFGEAPLPDSAPAQEAEAEVAEPTTVRVPSLGIRSRLTDLGVAADGTVEVPADYDLAGWFTGGPRPGQRGPAVILGHVDSRSGPAVFAEVDQLVPGDVIEVDRADGSTVAFHVDRLEQVPKDQFPSAAVYGPVPGPALRLITCGGEFDAATGHYRDNVVVFASPVA
jgi:hypothetical protein